MSLRKLLPLILLAFCIPAGAQSVNGVPSQTVSANQINSTALSALATGPLCNTTSTGVPTICNPTQVETAAPLLVASPAPLNTTAIQAIPRAGTTAVNGVFNGDSYNVADHTNAGLGNGPAISTNRIPEQIRINYQALYGNGGTGIVPLVLSFGTSPEILNSEAWTVAGTYDTTVTALGPTQSSDGTIVHLNTADVATFNDARAINYNGGNLYFATSASSGTITVAVDGTTVGTASASSFTAAGTAAGGYTPRMLTVSSFASGTSHSVTFTASGDCYIYGWEGTNGTTGVRIHNVSVGGAVAGSVGSSAATENAFTDLIPGGVQFETLAFTTNDAANSVTTGNFSTYLTNTIAHFQAMSSHPTVVLVAPPVSIVNSSFAESPYTAIITGLGTTLGVTTVNMQNQGSTVGGTYVGFGTATPLSTNNWLDWTGGTWPGSGNAGVHPSDIGAPVEAQLESSAILNPLGASCGQTVGVCAINGGAAAVAATITSTNTAGTFMEVLGTGTNVDTWTFASAGSGTLTGGKTALFGDLTTGSYALGLNVNSSGVGSAFLTSSMSYCWTSGISITTSACDTNLSRGSNGVIAVGTGALGSVAGSMSMTNLTLAGKINFAAARKGTFVCTSGGAITVANANAITTSDIIITTNTPGGTQTYPPNKTGGTSGTNFIETCATGDTSTYNYDILN